MEIMVFPLKSCLPFLGFLLSISFGPLIFKSFWSKIEGYNILFWGLLAVATIFFYQTVPFGMVSIADKIITEFLPFIILISSLYIISTGVTVHLSMPATSGCLTFYLAVGTLLSSFIGTTGASILLVRPLLYLLKDRVYKSHTLVFFIFLVANCGGCLTPLGDPPLFMGYMKGVSFSWPLKNLWFIYLITCVLILCVYYIVDQYYAKKEDFEHHIKHHRLKIVGYYHFCLLMFVVLISFGVGALKDNPQMLPIDSTAFIHVISNVLILLLMLMSLKIRDVTQKIDFHPVFEVIKVFIVIFVALIPIEFILEHQNTGFIDTIKAFINKNGVSDPFRYFWLCGSFSAFLDNAPTYLIFFKMAGGKAKVLMNELAQTLRGISLGSIFMGAFTYIGNAPNLMVRAIAEDAKIQMPGFLGYILYSSVILLPIFLFVTLWLL